MVRRSFLSSLALFALLVLPGCPPKHGPSRPPRADIAAISDLHLGDSRSILDLDEGRKVLLDLVATLCHERGVKTLVLDGDVLELSLASEEQAYESARKLFADLNRVRGLERIVVVVGNHDHRLFEDIPDPLPEKISREYDTGTRFHRELSEVTDRLRVTVVYPGWSVPVDGGIVHFTHGHYFDRKITPKFDAEMTLAEVEERNQEWWNFLNAGGENATIRSLYRSAYHFGHHVKGLVDSIGGAEEHEKDPDEMSTREQDRVAIYLEEYPEAIGLVSGHTHANGGRVQTVLRDGNQIGVFDPGAWVVGHHGHKPRPHVFLLDSRKGEMRLEPVKIPEDVLEATIERAFEKEEPH